MMHVGLVGTLVVPDLPAHFTRFARPAPSRGPFPQLATGHDGAVVARHGRLALDNHLLHYDSLAPGGEADQGEREGEWLFESP